MLSALGSFISQRILIVTLGTIIKHSGINCDYSSCLVSIIITWTIRRVDGWIEMLQSELIDLGGWILCVSYEPTTLQRCQRFYTNFMSKLHCEDVRRLVTKIFRTDEPPYVYEP